MPFTPKAYVASTGHSVDTRINAKHAEQDTLPTRNVAHTKSVTSTSAPAQAPNQDPPTTHKAPNKLRKPDYGIPNLSLPTPININALRTCLQNYDATFLINGFSVGFHISDDSPTSSSCPSNSHTISDAPEIIRDKLRKEIAAGRIAGPYDAPPFQPFHISPLALRPKKQLGKYRLLHNLSHPYDTTSVNHNIPQHKRTVQYATVGEAITKIMKLPHGSFAAKTDIESAFRLLPIHPKHYPKLGMQLDGKYYYDKVLPQGLASSCQLFESFSSAIQWIIENQVPEIQVVHYLDDFLVIAPDKHTCQEHLDALLALFGELGVPIAHEKTTIPSQIVTFLGIELDTNAFQARLPIEKLIEYRGLLKKYTKDTRIKKRDLDSLIGKLSFAASVIPARAFLRRLINLSCTTKIPYHYIKIQQWVFADISTWLEFMEKYNGVTFFRHPRQIPSNEINLISDASKLGFGAAFGSHWIQERWPQIWTTFHITVLEMYPVYVIIAMFSHKLRNSNILFHCDNSAVVTIINKQSSKDARVMSIVRPLILVLMENNISLRSQHIPGKLNVLSDRISRFQVDGDLLQQYGMQRDPTTIPCHLRPGNFKML